MKYIDFIDLNYKPATDDLVCLFRIEPSKGISMKEAVGRVASESSTGTWAENLATETVEVKKKIKRLVCKGI